MAFCITNINNLTVIDDSPAGASCLTTTSSNITITKGSTFILIFDLSNNTTASDGSVTSVAADLSGYSINGSIQETATSNTDYLFMSTQNRMISIDSSTSRVTLNIPVKHTSRLPLGTKYYCLKLIAADGNTQNLIQGIVTIQ